MYLTLAKIHKITKENKFYLEFFEPSKLYRTISAATSIPAQPQL